MQKILSLAYPGKGDSQKYPSLSVSQCNLVASISSSLILYLSLLTLIPAAYTCSISPCVCCLQVNVEGTHIVLACAKGNGIKKFIFTSTMDVVLAYVACCLAPSMSHHHRHSAGRSTINENEDELQYPSRFL